MRLLYHQPFDAREIEHYRQLVFNNLTCGMQALLGLMQDMDLKLSEELQECVEMITNASGPHGGKPFPMAFFNLLKVLWADSNVQEAWRRGNEAARLEK